jgi:hypothetical protein
MKWSYGGCLQLSPSKLDLLQDILQSIHDGLSSGFLRMSNAEVEDFNQLCDDADLDLRPFTNAEAPQLRRVK